jgi:hypothetical protein
MIGPDGALSQEAVRRVQAALLARAYGDANLVAALVESTDTSIRAIGGALMDVAPEWARMRAEAQAGQISREADQTARLLEAVRLVERARREGRKVAEYVSQRDLFSGQALHPVAEKFLRLMFWNDRGWTKPAGRDTVAEGLGFYATEAMKTVPGVDLLGETAASPERILEVAKEKQRGSRQEQAAFALGSPAAVAAGENARPSGGDSEVEAGRRRQAQIGQGDARAGADAQGEVTNFALRGGARIVRIDRAQEKAGKSRALANGRHEKGALLCRTGSAERRICRAYPHHARGREPYLDGGGGRSSARGNSPA